MFITIEGGDGVGKSTLAKKMAVALSKKRKKVLLTKEPGATKVGEQIKEIIMNNQLDPVTEMILFWADREQHVKEIIEPALRAGKIVICDRYHLSTRAYQIHGRQIRRAGRGVTLGMSTSITALKPNFIFLLDGNGFDSKQIDRIGLESRDFHERVRKGFLNDIKQYVKAGTACVIDVDAMSEEEVFSYAMSILNSIIA